MTALHGFLGLPTDWESLFEGDRGGVTAPNWYSALQELPDLPSLATVLNRSADAEGDTLLGYSMGGRIALHMLLDEHGPAKWARAVIVSASPGFSDRQVRTQRWEQDRLWAERFLSEQWETLIDSWNAQPVFGGEPVRPRPESEFKRSELAAALLNGSVGRQNDLRHLLRTLRIPVLWIAGEHDRRYCDLATECAALNPLFEARIVSDAGHRLPWTQPEAFRRLLQAWTP